MLEKRQSIHSNYNILFNRVNFKKALVQIEALANQTENDKSGPIVEIELLRQCGALQMVLPGNLLDFNEPNTLTLLKILRDIGRANLSVGRIFEGHINALYLIHLFATKEQKTNWFSGVAENGDLFGVWNSQDQNGTSFVSSQRSFELKGFKTFCSGCTFVNKALITGQIKHKSRDGWQMAIVDMDRLEDRQIDFESWKPLGMQASGSYSVNFSGFKLKTKDLLGDIGNYYKQPYFSGGAIRFAAVQLGGAEAIAYGTINYLKILQRTDDPIQQLRLSKMMSAITAGNLWISQAGKHYDTWAGDQHNENKLLAFANMTRAAIEEICLQVIEDSNRCVGAKGLMAPFAFGRMTRDLTFYLRQPAPDATRLAVAEYFIKHTDGI